MPTKASRNVDLGQVFAQSQQNAERLTELSNNVGKAVDELRGAIERLGTRLSTATAPNMMLMASWAGVLLSVIAMIAAPIAYHFNHSIEQLDLKLQKEYTLVNETVSEKVSSLRKETEQLDVRLQREFALANEGIRETAKLAEKAADRVHHELEQRIVQLETKQWEQIKGDLDELRMRRLQGQHKQ